ncbi:MAG: AMP-binding protein, partial [bacterium]|nr:AMP-binding protein [bacterium]
MVKVNGCKKLFRRETLQRFIDYFKNILSSVLDDPNQSLWQFHMVPEEKRTAIINRLNRDLESEVSEIMGDSLLQTRLNGSLNRFPDRVALQYGDVSVGYRELERRANIIANWLIDNGVKKETFVGILIGDRVESIVTLTGIVKAGCVVVPLYPGSPDQGLQHMIRTTHLEYIFVDEPNRPRFPGATLFLLSPEEICSAVINPAKEKTPPVHSEPEDPLYIHFTSGTTGQPRAIVGKNKSLLHFINWEIQTFGLDRETRTAQFTIPGFDPFLR